MQGSKTEQYIEIGIEEERYALKIDAIHEIIKMQAITVLPNTLNYIKGVINLRGKIVTILSLRGRFGFPEQAPTKTTRIVVVTSGDDMIGIVVDRVNQVTSFAAVQPPPAHVGQVKSAFFTGIGETKDGLVCILKLEQVLGRQD